MEPKRINLSKYKGYENYMIYHNDDFNEWYCGYAVLPENHVLYDAESEFDEGINNIAVHGGVTYMKDHVIGFDCMHYGDSIINCNKEFVIAEIHKMIDQLIEM